MYSRYVIIMCRKHNAITNILHVDIEFVDRNRIMIHTRNIGCNGINHMCTTTRNILNYNRMSMVGIICSRFRIRIRNRGAHVNNDNRSTRNYN